MDYHHHARLTCHGREGLAKSVVEGRLSLREAAAERGLSRQSAGKWVRRYREAGPAGLEDRSSRPRSSPRSTSATLVERVEQLRRERWTGVRISQATGLSRATVSRILVRLKLNKVGMLEPKIPVVRYERDTPGDLLHIDIKKLARIKKPGHRITGNPQDETRGAGWEFLYVAVDDHSRMAYVAMMPDEKAASASSFVRQRSRLLRSTQHPAARGHDRQRPLLRLQAVPRYQPKPATQTYPYANLHAPHQRQGRTLHPDSHPGMGLRTPLSKLRRTQQTPRTMDPPVQLASTTC
jgi:transposase